MPTAATAITMTPRQRYIETLTFGKPDRIPFQPGYGRESTLRTWRTQGLPADVKDYHAYVRQLLGIEAQTGEHAVYPGVDFLMRSQFEEKVIERRSAPPGAPAGQRGTLVVQDWKGNVCEISDEFDTRYLRTAIDFVTRSWLKCPVESRADWADMARRYDANDPGRFPEDWKDRCAKLRGRNYVAGIHFSGPFWQLREWLGFEGLCMMFLDDPDFVRDMIEFWQEFVAQVLEKVLRDFTPDFVHVSEDMAYKEKPMIGPEMSAEFLAPCWKRWGKLIKGAGVPIYDVDSDGFIESLIPVWIDSGFNVCDPIEVAANNDLVAMRRRFGTKMAYCGGVDKRAMAKGGQAIRDEIERLRPAIEAGGIIPGCDHGVPSDVSWPNFVEYCRLLAQVTGWL